MAASDDDSIGPDERYSAVRIIDVNLNRSAEGMRVVEEYCRFVLGSPDLTGRCKWLRDELHRAVQPLERKERLTSRDTPGDVGTTVEFTTEIRPETSIFSLRQIALVNSERVKQAL